MGPQFSFGGFMRLRTLRRAAERAREKSVERQPERNHDIRRQVWHEQLGSKDRKGCEGLVNETFGFKEEEQ
jgi:hypothetical protein